MNKRRNHAVFLDNLSGQETVVLRDKLRFLHRLPGAGCVVKPKQFNIKIFIKILIINIKWLIKIFWNGESVYDQTASQRNKVCLQVSNFLLNRRTQIIDTVKSVNVPVFLRQCCVSQQMSGDRKDLVTQDSLQRLNARMAAVITQQRLYSCNRQIVNHVMAKCCIFLYKIQFWQ